MKNPLTPEQKKSRNRENQRRWRANNPEKVKAQKRRYHEKTYVARPKPYENEQEWQRFRKRLDVLLVGDSYLRENIARRWKCKSSEVPDEILEICRPLLNLKRSMKEIKSDKWIDISEGGDNVNMKFLKGWFKNRTKKVKCTSCRDFGVYKEAVSVLHVLEFCDKVKAVMFVSPTEERFQFKPCPSRCEAWRENNEKDYLPKLREGS
jgi:hypothetical protein